MTGLLALVGGDPFTSGCTFDRILIDNTQATEVLILPTAAAYENPAQLTAEAEGYFAEMDVAVRALDVLSRGDALKPANVDIIRSAKCIYLLGGSALHAKSVLMRSPVWEALVDAWNGGASVAGTGEGGEVLCDPMVDSRGGAFTVGLGLISNVAVLSGRNHWSEESLQRTRELSSPDLVVLGVDEGTAAIRSPDGAWRAEGRGIVEAHLGGRKVELEDVNR